jgi:hypothetical protein
VRQHGQVLQQVTIRVVEEHRGRRHPADHRGLGRGLAMEVERLDPVPSDIEN